MKKGASPKSAKSASQKPTGIVLQDPPVTESAVEDEELNDSYPNHESFVEFVPPAAFTDNMKILDRITPDLPPASTSLSMEPAEVYKRLCETLGVPVEMDGYLKWSQMKTSAPPTTPSTSRSLLPPEIHYPFHSQEKKGMKMLSRNVACGIISKDFISCHLDEGYEKTAFLESFGHDLSAHLRTSPEMIPVPASTIFQMVTFDALTSEMFAQVERAMYTSRILKNPDAERCFQAFIHALTMFMPDDVIDAFIEIMSIIKEVNGKYGFPFSDRIACWIYVTTECAHSARNPRGMDQFIEALLSETQSHTATRAFFKHLKHKQQDALQIVSAASFLALQSEVDDLKRKRPLSQAVVPQSRVVNTTARSVPDDVVDRPKLRGVCIKYFRDKSLCTLGDKCKDLHVWPKTLPPRMETYLAKLIAAVPFPASTDRPAGGAASVRTTRSTRPSSAASVTSVTSSLSSNDGTL